jgi:hypothetical protein
MLMKFLFFKKNGNGQEPKHDGVREDPEEVRED